MKRNWKFNTIGVRNRWKTPKYARNCDWNIFGFGWWWSSSKEKSFRVHLFGIDISVWFCKINNNGTK